MMETLEQILAAYDAWLDQQPLAEKNRVAYRLRVFTPGKQWRLLPTCANGCPAFGLYRRKVGEDGYQPSSLWVLGVEGEQIGSIVVFVDVTSFTAFGLPSTIEGEAGGQEA